MRVSVPRVQRVMPRVWVAAGGATTAPPTPAGTQARVLLYLCPIEGILPLSVGSLGGLALLASSSLTLTLCICKFTQFCKYSCLTLVSRLTYASCASMCLWQVWHKMTDH